MQSFETSLLKVTQLAQEDPLATTTDPALVDAPVDAPASLMPAPTILYPWILAQVIVGFAGYMGYQTDVQKSLDDLWKNSGLTDSDADHKLFDDSLVTDGFWDSDPIKGFKLTRLIGLSTTLVGFAGAAAAFVAPDLFPIFTYVSALGGVGFLT